MNQPGAESGVGASSRGGTPDDGLPSRKRYRDQAQRDYFPRTVGFALGTLAGGSVLYEIEAGTVWWILLVVNGFLWPHLAFLLARRSADPSRFELGSLLMDSAMVGLWTAVMQFHLLAAGLLASMVWLDNIAVRGVRFFVKGLLATAVGILAGGLVVGFTWRPEPSLLTTACSLPMLLVYPQLFGFWTNRILQRLHEKRRALERLSQLDGLSGVNNRQYWEFLARGEFNRSRRQGLPCSLLLLDIDRFKEFNDVHGHVAGDEVIRRVGRILQECVRLEDPIGRYGGEEFAIVLTGAHAGEALFKAESIRRSVNGNHANGGIGERITASIGVAELTDDIEEFMDWVERADQALYRAKQHGRNRCMDYAA